MSRHDRYLCPASCPLAIPDPVACWHDCTRVVLSIIFYDMHDYHKIRDVRSSTDHVQDSPSLSDLPWYVEKRLALQDAIGKSRPRLIDSMVTCPFRPIRRITYFARSLRWGMDGVSSLRDRRLGIALGPSSEAEPWEEILNVLRGFQRALGAFWTRSLRSDCARCTSMRLWPAVLPQGCRPA